MVREIFQLICAFRVFKGAQETQIGWDRCRWHARRAILAGLLSAACVCAHAALECDQVMVVAQTAVKLRDEGATLTAVLREIDTPEMRQKLDAKEINLLRQIVRLSFTSEASLHEIAEACKSGELGLPKPKPVR